jgi:hydrogenase maturation protease
MPSTPGAPEGLVIGLGNSWAGDDAAGVLVARALRASLPEGVALIEHEGEPTALIDVWADKRIVILVDAIAGGAPPGTVRYFDATTSELPSSFSGRSTHAFTVAQAIELARSLDRLPAQLMVVGIEGANFEAGAAIGQPVAEAIEPAGRRVLELLRTNY